MNAGQPRTADLMHYRSAPNRMAADWKTRAACLGKGRVMDAETEEDEVQARTICQGCPVLRECYEWALSLPTRDVPPGILAGHTAAERGGFKAAAKRKRNAA